MNGIVFLTFIIIIIVAAVFLKSLTGGAGDLYSSSIYRKYRDEGIGCVADSP